MESTVSFPHLIRQSLARPYRVPLSMILLFALVPLYIFIPALFPPESRNVPELSLDRAIPLLPSWSLVYGALYMFLILLPIFVVRDDAHIRLTVSAYLLIWITSYVFFFWIYPTAAPRPAMAIVTGFGGWGLGALYGADPPYNCFPSLHVAHSFVSALAVIGVHRRLGAIALISAALVAASTLFTKQHYVVDVVAGVALALMAYAIFLRRYPAERVSDLDRRVAPAMAVCVGALVTAGLLGFWLLYLWSGETRFQVTP